MKKEQLAKVLPILLLCTTVIAIAVAIWALFSPKTETPLVPDYAPADTNAQTIPGDTGEMAESDQGGGSVSLNYSNQVTIDISSRQATLMFANPKRSNQDILIQIIIQDQVLAQTGRITPGYQVTTADLLEGASHKLTTGGYDGKFIIFYYDAVTGEKAVVNTEIPIKIIVKE